MRDANNAKKLFDAKKKETLLTLEMGFYEMIKSPKFGLVQ